MRLLEAPDEEAAVEALHAEGLTDGLPVIVPTVERVERMVLASGLAPDLVVGRVGPGDRLATIEAVAANAVMAGCLPDYMPVVVAAVEAICDPAFDLGEVQVTTHNLGPTLIVNGPARHGCGPFASGLGALGPGHRANATVGRAVRLVMTTVGGGRPGVTDMSVLGQPAKFTCCLAEAEEASPFPPLHVALGLDEGQSAVTVIGTEGPHSVVANVGLDEEGGPERLLTLLAAAASNLGCNNPWLCRGATVLVLNPGHAAILAKGGYDREAIQHQIVERARHPRRLLDALSATASPADAPKMPWNAVPGDPDDLLPIRDPADVVVVVAGGSGGYSAVMPTWGAAAHGNRPVVKPVRTDQACDLPWTAGPST